MTATRKRICSEPLTSLPLNSFYRITLIFIMLIACGLVEARAYPALEYAVKQTNTPTFYIDFNGDSNADRVINFGGPSFIGLAGDFDGDTITDLAVYDNGTWYIDFFNDAIADKQVVFGGPASLDKPVENNLLDRKSTRLNSSHTDISRMP